MDNDLKGLTRWSFVLFFLHAGLGQNQQTDPPVCFTCDKTSNPELCRETATCGTNEACSVQEVYQPHGDVYFWSGCEDIEVCSSLAESIVDNSVIIGKRQERGIQRCAYCCGTSLCNSNCSSFVNLALNKPAYQSSTSYNGTADLAVDGNTEKNYYKGSCTHTTYEHYPWWSVDLLHTYHITKVKLYERNDAHDGRSFHLRVLISQVNATRLDRTSHQFTQCGYYYGHSSDGNTITIDCPKNTTGRWVRVQQSDPNLENMHLCEVEVFGF